MRGREGEAWGSGASRPRVYQLRVRIIVLADCRLRDAGSAVGSACIYCTAVRVACLSAGSERADSETPARLSLHCHGGSSRLSAGPQYLL